MTIGIVGLGYVGLPLAVAFAQAGHDVVGVDLDAETVAGIAAGRSHIEDVPDDVLAATSERLTATTDYSALSAADAVLICVPTPLSPNREPDLGPLLAAGASLAQVVRAGQLVVLESTTYPGTTREQLVPLLEATGLKAGSDVNVAFSPERVDPGRTDHTIRNTPKVVGGLTPACGERAAELYRAICDDVIQVSTPEVAELSKLLENIFRSVNIALVNELAMLADRMGIDIWEVVDAASTKPFGFMRFEPGPGMGGHCLPVDPFYLSWRAREFESPTEFIEIAGKINQQMPAYCVQRIARELNEQSKPLKGSSVLLLGVAYKPDVGDMRESPALKMIKLLQARGADVSYHDPHVPELDAGIGLRSVPLDEAVAGADIVVIVTPHSAVDHAAVAGSARAMLDLRGVTRGAGVEGVARL
jgi:UDP-N-acetyl-D-glucosamine dehydrogenase